MVDLLKGNRERLFSPKKMERDKKKNELLNFIREYRFLREEELVFSHSKKYGRSSEYVSKSETK